MNLRGLISRSSKVDKMRTVGTNTDDDGIRNYAINNDNDNKKVNNNNNETRKISRGTNGRKRRF